MDETTEVKKRGYTRKSKEEPVRPLGVPEISIEDRVEALEVRIEALEKIVDQHQRYHFGKRE